MDNNKTILFIAYYFTPYASVGAFRMSYWAKHLGDFGYKAEVLTATAQASANPDIHYIPDDKKGLLKHFIKDSGSSWYHDIAQFIRHNPEKRYDAVIISGGPFMHFGLSDLLKRTYGCKVILDFRDPFARNPRLHSGLIKQSIKSFFERRFIRKADHVLTVNAYCKDLLATAPDTKVTLIENGYDESHFTTTSMTSSSSLNLVYAGRFYYDCPIEPFLFVLAEPEQASVMFNYIGTDTAITDTTHTKHHGYLPYDQTIQIIQKSDVGVVFTGGKAFESTTKIFDYIGANKKILIITNGTPRTGNIHEITKELPGIFWATNDAVSIHQALAAIGNEQSIPQDIPDRYLFSRRAGLEKLVNVLETL